MSRKKTRRKVYGLLVNPIEYIKESMAPIDPKVIVDLQLRERSALEAFRMGVPTIEDWRACADVLNLAETMGKDGIGPEVLPVCMKAQEVLTAGHQRHQAHGTIGRAAGEYEVLLDLVEYHELQRASIPRSVYERVIKKTAAKIRSCHPDLKVCMS